MKLLVDLVLVPGTELLEPVGVIGNICRVKLPIRLESMLGPNLRAVAEKALTAVDAAAGYLGEDAQRLLRAEFSAIMERVPPCNHCFSKLTRTHRRTQTVFSVWYRADIGYYQIVVDARRDDSVRSEVVHSSSDPIYIEDDFPIHDSVISDDTFMLRDREKRILASLPVPGALPANDSGAAIRR